MYIEKMTVWFHKSGSVHLEFESIQKTNHGIKTTLRFEVPKDAEVSRQLKRDFASFDVKRLTETIRNKFFHPSLGEFLEKDLVVDHCFWTESGIYVSLIRGVDLSLALSPEQIEDVFGKSVQEDGSGGGEDGFLDDEDGREEYRPLHEIISEGLCSGVLDTDSDAGFQEASSLVSAKRTPCDSRVNVPAADWL